MTNTARTLTLILAFSGPWAADAARAALTADDAVKLALANNSQIVGANASVFDAQSYKEVARLAVGQGGANIGFTRDGATGFMSVTGANSVAVIDMARFNVVAQLKAGTQPQGLIIL